MTLHLDRLWLGLGDAYYLPELCAASLRGAMGLGGTCADNAAMESFFSLLRKNVLNRRGWATHAEPRDRRLDRDHLPRPQTPHTLRRLTLVEFETALNAAYAA